MDKKYLTVKEGTCSTVHFLDCMTVFLFRENEALWREISDLRQKHAHQQQLIKKVSTTVDTSIYNICNYIYLSLCPMICT